MRVGVRRTSGCRRLTAVRGSCPVRREGKGSRRFERPGKASRMIRALHLRPTNGRHRLSYNLEGGTYLQYFLPTMPRYLPRHVPLCIHCLGNSGARPRNCPDPPSAGCALAARWLRAGSSAELLETRGKTTPQKGEFQQNPWGTLGISTTEKVSPFQATTSFPFTTTPASSPPFEVSIGRTWAACLTV